MSKEEKGFRSLIKERIKELEKNLYRSDFGGRDASEYRLGKLDGYRNAISDVRELIAY